MKVIVATLMAVLLLSSTTLSSGAQQDSAGCLTLLDIEYGDQDSALQRLSVIAPATGHPCPIFVLLHGGGWIHGDKQSLYSHARRLASEGIAVVVPNYRLSPAVRFPAHAEDVASAIAWTHAHASEWGGNPDSLYLVGHSAGAHLASLMALDTSYLQAVGLATHDLAGLILVSGVYRIVPQEGGATEEFISMIFGPDPDDWAKASPIDHVFSADSGKTPPILLIWSDGEDPLMVKESAEFERTLRQSGLCVQVQTLSGSDHSQGLNSVDRKALVHLPCNY